MKIKYFKSDHGCLIFNPYSLEIMILNKNMSLVLSQILPENYTEKEKILFEKKLNEVRNDNFRKTLKSILNTQLNIYNEESKTITISFAPLHKCNLKCKYCFASGGNNYKGTKKEMSSELINGILNFIFNYYCPNCVFLQISLVSGGEPFLNLEVLNDINERINSYNEKIDRKIFIATNGTIYNESIRNMLLKISPQLGISIDGPAEFHNSNRLYANGDNTYHDVTKTILDIKKDQNILPITKNFIFMTVLNDQNMDLVKIIKHHKKLGATSIQIKAARSTRYGFDGINEKNIHKYKEAYNHLNDFFLEEFKNKKYDSLMLILNGIDTYGKLVKRLMLRQPSKYRCGAGKDRLSFTADGDIYPCDNFVGEEIFKLGNVYEESYNLFNINFNEFSVNNLIPCKDCWARHLCTGDCLYNAYVKTGDLSNQDPIMCEFYLFLCELAIRFIMDLRLIDYELYQKFERLIQIRNKNNFIN